MSVYYLSFYTNKYIHIPRQYKYSPGWYQFARFSMLEVKLGKFCPRLELGLYSQWLCWFIGILYASLGFLVVHVRWRQVSAAVARVSAVALSPCVPPHRRRVSARYWNVKRVDTLLPNMGGNQPSMVSKEWRVNKGVSGWFDVRNTGT